MNEQVISNKTILIYRIVFAGLSWFTLITNNIIYGISWFSSFRTFSIQTNYIVTIWFTLAIILHKNPESLGKITGPLKGAFTMYITITFLVFAILLSPFYQPTGWAAFSNSVIHYITPIAFIVDWALTETKVRYEWNYLLYWMIYPLCYILFAVIHGIITGNYIYYFLDINALGVLVFVMFVSVLIAFGFALGSLYIWINRKRTKD